jgi:hypothetical protein
MKIAHEETIKSIVAREDKPGAVAAGKVRENTSPALQALKVDSIALWVQITLKQWLPKTRRRL